MTKRGRPEFKATRAMRREVEQMVAVGMSEDDVARAIGCATPTLAKHFAEELATGRAKKRAEVIKLLFKTARKGNVSAQKKLEAMTGAGAGAAAAPQAKLGKKEEAELAALNPDTSSTMGELMARRTAAVTKH
jgi:hypothetical protein